MGFMFRFMTMALILFIPGLALAWGPGAHLYYGMSVLEMAASWYDAVGRLLINHPMVYLYGCVAADIVLAKKFGPKIHHNHNWQNAMLLLQNAKSDRQKAFAYGYLSHLASDVVSHNCFVPRQTVLSFDKPVFKHVYWEMRFDQKISNQKIMKLFRSLARWDVGECDDLFKQNIQVRIGNFALNKLVFNQTLLLCSIEKWQSLMAHINHKSDVSLPDQDLHHFASQSIKAIHSFLKEGEHSSVLRCDPKGEQKLTESIEIKNNLVTQKLFLKKIHRHEVTNLSEKFKQSPF